MNAADCRVVVDGASLLSPLEKSSVVVDGVVAAAAAAYTALNLERQDG
ncbi:hypothetical protein BIW11_01262 [Tropilaelaps mercedesae]|uniref:Uncharacterized protein n=1 Tax=Tropilaelaps mercedesae TaxID=418985 RepID=A0A1V9XGU8_9ACAR|nr:hypothetical protein BIW11_01262 [Tropilaelaps mercedesae]